MWSFSVLTAMTQLIKMNDTDIIDSETKTWVHGFGDKAVVVCEIKLYISHMGLTC